MSLEAHLKSLCRRYGFVCIEVFRAQVESRNDETLERGGGEYVNGVGAS